jgi:DNA polymerase III epsilon subunit-like protein
LKILSARQANVCAWAHCYLHQTEAWAVLDTETSGLTHRDEVIELALVDASGAVLFSSLIQTQNPQREELASHIHGITPQMLATAPTFPQIWPTIEALFSRYQHILVYNAPFDSHLLEVTALRYGYRLPSVSWSCLMDQYALYHGAWNDYHQSYTWQKLQVACARLGVQMDGNYHRATADALSTLGVLHALAARHMPQEGGQA